MTRSELPAAAIVLAGGRSRRLGQDKAFVQVGKRELLQWTLRATRSFDPVILVVNDTARYEGALRRYGWSPGLSSEGGGKEWCLEADRLLLISDRQPGLGPLAGIETGLRATPHPFSWVLGCDLPFVTGELGRFLINELAGLATELRSPGAPPRALVPVVDRRAQPLCAAYERGAALVARACIDEGILAVGGFVNRLTVHSLSSRKLTELGDAGTLFLNVNTREALNEARRRAAGG